MYFCSFEFSNFNLFNSSIPLTSIKNTQLKILKLLLYPDKGKMHLVTNPKFLITKKEDGLGIFKTRARNLGVVWFVLDVYSFSLS